MGKEIEREGDQIDVSGALSVAEQRPLHTLTACQNPQLRFRNSASAVVVRMQGENHVFAVIESVAHVFDLVCINVRHREGNRGSKIDDDRVSFLWFPDIQHRIADFHSKIKFGSGKAFRCVLKQKFTVRFSGIFGQPFCAGNRDFNNLAAGFLENLFPLCNRGGIVKMDDCFAASIQCLKCFSYDMFSCRGDNLYGDILRNQFLLDQCADKLKFCFGCCRKTDFNLLKSQFAKKLKNSNFFPNS